MQPNVRKYVVEHFEKRKTVYLTSKEARALAYSLASKVLSFLSRPAETKKPFLRVLELGCGAGTFLKRISASMNADLYGIDVCKPMLELAKRQTSKKVNFLLSDAENLPFRKNLFDVIVFQDLLHHLVRNSWALSKRNIRKALKEIARISKISFIYF